MSSARKSKAPCHDCGVEPRLYLSSYCKGCKGARVHDWQMRNKRSRAAVKRRDPNACNCGTAGCSGLSCDRLTL